VGVGGGARPWELTLSQVTNREIKLKKKNEKKKGMLGRKGDPSEGGSGAPREGRITTGVTLGGHSAFIRRGRGGGVKSLRIQKNKMIGGKKIMENEERKQRSISLISSNAGRGRGKDIVLTEGETVAQED